MMQQRRIEVSQVDPLLQVTDLSKHFSLRKERLWGGEPQVLRAVDNVTFEVGRGESFGLVGESGSGKSTLARSILRLHEPTSGRIVFRGTDITHLPERDLRPLRRHMQMVFQDTKSSLNPRLRIRDIVAEPLVTHKLPHSAADVNELMDKAGLSEVFLDRFPHQLSGGQRQRVGIARALALSPELIVADEPVSALDVSIQAQILNLLKVLQSEMGITFLLIAHDISVVTYFCQRVAVMYLGKVVELGPSREVMGNPSHPYTRALVSAVPRTDPRSRRSRIVLRGEIPSPLSPPTGCPFHTRCPVKIGPICSEVAPPAYPTASGGWAACHLLAPGTGASNSASSPLIQTGEGKV
ncbi:MAG: ABC transporter ATP-binding protein [Thermomicrobiales bacterium]|nr:ABC transporter ATP-binding protein [Thermomicrobiales bacterium]